MTFYHGTHSEALQSIRERGLIGPTVWVTSELEIAEMYADTRAKQYNDKPALVCLELDFATLTVDPNSDDDRGAYCSAAIPPSEITDTEVLNSY